jgi:prepilin-type N-terminal cleavage/methylation domain-containing protein
MSYLRPQLTSAAHPSRHARAGFTLFELLIVVALIAILATIAFPKIGQTVARSKVAQAATVIVGDLEQASALAARSRRPVIIRCECTDLTLLVRDRGLADSVRVRRAFGPGSGMEIGTLTLSQDSVVIFPSGIVSDTLAVTLTSRYGYSRTVTLSRGGRPRLLPP